jgi:hypothetical protein
METFRNLFQSDQIVALAIASFIFFVTIILVAINRIGFSMTLLLLLFSLLVGLAVNNQSTFQSYMSQPIHKIDESQDAFNKQMQLAIANLQSEVDLEKNNLLRLMGQMLDVLDHVEQQKQKLETFIERTHSQFNEEESKPKSAENQSKT